MTAATVIGEWTTVDKSGWGPGPWQDEPDKIHWIDPVTDLDCLMHRGPGGAWCGYVAVTEGHPYFAVDYSGCPVGCGETWCEHSPEDLTDVHGGLTFAGFCAESHDPATGICHVAQPGRPDRVWWLGFDCAHSQDIAPRMEARERERGWPPLRDGLGVYRDRAYVEAEVRSLAKQLRALA